MKNQRLLVSAILIALTAALQSCETHPDLEVRDSGLHRVRVGVAGRMSKAENQSSEEKELNSLDVFVFDEAGALLYHERTSGSHIDIELTKGRRQVKALVNAPASVSALSTLSQVTLFHLPLANQTRGNFFMSGGKTVTIDDDLDEVIINVSRDVAKVELVNLPTFNGVATGGTFMEAYLINVPKEYNTSVVISSANQSWNFNDTVASESEQDALLKLTGTGSVYGMPNATDEAESIEDVDYVTKLVLKANIGGRIYWYPIGIPDMTANKRYIIENAYINGPGSDSPNKYADDSALTAVVTSTSVESWDFLDETPVPLP